MELYNKYRPKNFDEVLGCDLAIKSINSELEHGTHVFLLVGPGGCGKTTIARIMAKKVGASDLDIHEINSADNRGIDTARDIMNQMNYPPSLDSNAIVWIMDECHKWTNDMQNAMLKSLEDVPEHIYFFLCTTDPQKLIRPLVTRCSKVEVSPMSDDNMFHLLKGIAKQEGIKCNPDIYRKIIELAKGSGRDGIKILSSVLYLDNDDERFEYLEKKNVTENEDAIELCRLLIKGSSWKNIGECLTKLKDDITNNPESIRQLVMSYAQSVLLKDYNTNAEAMLQAFSQTDTYKNGKYAITVGCLDTLSLINQ